MTNPILPLVERSRIIALACLGLAFLSSCSTVMVTQMPGMVAREGFESARILANFDAGEPGVRQEDGDSFLSLITSARQMETLGRRGDAGFCYLKCAVEAQATLASGSKQRGSDGEKALLQVHNSALSRFAEIWASDPGRSKGVPMLLSHRGETIEVAFSGESDFAEDLFDRVVASDSLHGMGVKKKRREGYGATLVGIRDKTPERSEEMRFFSVRGMHVPVTMTIRKAEPAKEDRARFSLTLHNPMLRETVTVGRRELPLAAHFSAPMETLLRGRNELLWGLKGFFLADERFGESGIFLGEPYDPGRIPVVLAHGLVSAPIIWRNLIPEFMADPEISRRYQFLVFTYPSSLTVSDSAHFFRTELAALRTRYDPLGQDPLSRDMIAIGHSMGGILTHILMAEIGDNFWSQISDRPLESYGLEPELEALAREIAFSDPDPAINRAVFLSTPHGGSKLAEWNITSFFTFLARLPSEVLLTTGDLIQGGRADGLKVDLGKKMTSLQSLQPDSPIVLALAKSPYKRGAVYHSIMGDRGRGNTPNSSDGVVEYWSSHQPGATSELIVPTGHTSYTHPEAIEEMKRILREHVGIR